MLPTLPRALYFTRKSWARGREAEVSYYSPTPAEKRHVVEERLAREHAERESAAREGAVRAELRP